MHLATRSFSHEKLPPCLLLPSLYGKGLEAADAARRPGDPFGAHDVGELLGWDEILDPDVAEHGQQCMLASYSMLDAHSGEIEAVPRLNKSCGRRGQLGIEGKVIACSYVFVDVDPFKETGGWPSLEEKREALKSAHSLRGPSGRWCAFYTTKNGYRLVYALKSPLFPVQFQGKVAGLMRELAAEGCYRIDAFDRGSMEWNRLMRPPFCQGEPEDEVVLDGRARFLHPDDLTTVLDPSNTHEDVDGLASGEILSRRAPTPGSQRELIWSYDGALTEAGLLVKKKLRNSYSYLYVFGGRVPDVGERDTVLTTGVGDTVARLIKVPIITPELVYALWEDVAMQMRHNDSTNWLEVLWDKVSRFWASDMAKLEEETKLRLDMAQHRDSLQVSAADKFQQHHPDCEIKSLLDPEDRARWLKEHSILVIGNHYHFLEPDRGVFCAYGLGSQVARTRPGRQIEPYGGTFSNKYYDPDTSKEKTLSWDQIIESRGVVAQHSEVHAAASQSGLGVTVEWRGNIVVACRRTVARSNLEPQRHGGVEEWLRLLAPGRENEFMAWLAYALAIDEGPTCALAMIGAGGSGKSFLAQELGRCLGDSKPINEWISGETRFTDGMDTAGVLKVEENITLRQGHDAAAALRRVISHEPISLEPKGVGAKESSYIPYRVVITGNSESVLRQVIMKAKSTLTERTATAQRILTVRPGSEATRYIRSCDTDRWREEQSIGRHLAWLYERREQWERGARFLVEGKTDISIDRMLWMENEGNIQVLRAILACAWQARGCHRQATTQRLASTYGISYSRDGRVFIDIEPILDWISEKGKSRVTFSHVSSILEDLAMGCRQEVPRKQVYFHPRGSDMSSAAFHEATGMRIAAPLERMISLAEMVNHEQVLSMWRAQAELLEAL